MDDEARRYVERVTLDVYASGDNAVVPRFFARHAEPAAEGVNAFAQPSWAVSRCPACGQRHREFPLIFSPRALLPATVAKLRADGVRGVVIVPYAQSDPASPTLMGASFTRVDNQRDACHSSSLSYSAVRDGHERTRRGTAPRSGGLRGGLRAAAARLLCRARRSAAMRLGARGQSCRAQSAMRTDGRLQP